MHAYLYEHVRGQSLMAHIFLVSLHYVLRQDLSLEPSNLADPASHLAGESCVSAFCVLGLEPGTYMGMES